MVTQTKPTKKALMPKIPTAVVKWKGEQIIVTFNDVRNLICRQATDQEIAVFLKTCQSLQLNPFANEVYLIKYKDTDKAAIVVSIGSYLKAAEANKDYNGNEAGIILKDSGGKLEFREGAFLLDDEKEKLVGGWAKVYRKNRDRPTYMAVNKAECVRYTREGEPTRFWTEEKQASMLRKSALKRALVEAFPSLFAGTISTGEIPESEEMPEGELPPALEKGGQPDWKKFWARVKSELGLTTEEARELLKVESVKEELIDAGWTMEKIWEELVAALQQQKATEVESLKGDEKSGEPAAGIERGEGEEQAGETISSSPKAPKIKKIVTPPAEPEPNPEVTKGLIDMDWLKESLKALQAKNLKAWSESNLLSYLKTTYKVEGKTVLDAVTQLDKGAAIHFVKKIQETLQML